MSESINLALMDPEGGDGEDVSEINLSLSVSGEKIYLIRKLLKNTGEENSKEVAESLIRMMFQEKRDNLESASLSDFEEAATFVLGEFGIPAHTKGYRYLREAIVLVAQSPVLVEGITKSLYPAIAALHGTTSTRVERVVRHAIESGCMRGDTQALYYYFPHSISKDKLKPTNAEFIAVMGDVVKKRVSKRQLVFADL
ncbi:MAG: sporulation initiation factor Spo0A C-terminal domain-containing protein [Clostridia bacterium]|nr:sporulation initiation factor Spo0A C-terminal domain-containing protein [Clostridia bacterium]